MPDSDSNDIEHRVAVLERQFLRLHEQVALANSEATAARVLAAGADHDVSEVRAELRAHTQALNALRETQLELSMQVKGLDQKVHGLDQKISGLDQKVHGLDQKVSGLDQKVHGLDQKVSGLDQKVTEGLAMLSTGMAQITALLIANGDSEQS